MKTTRRSFFKSAALAPLSVLASTSLKDQAALKILCIGGHPDDPESGCGGTLAKLSAAGHDVTAVYLTRGEAGIGGKSHVEAAAIRKMEKQQKGAVSREGTPRALSDSGRRRINR